MADGATGGAPRDDEDRADDAADDPDGERPDREGSADHDEDAPADGDADGGDAVETGDADAGGPGDGSDGEGGAERPDADGPAGRPDADGFEGRADASAAEDESGDVDDGRHVEAELAEASGSEADEGDVGDVREVDGSSDYPGSVGSNHVAGAVASSDDEVTVDLDDGPDAGSGGPSGDDGTGSDGPEGEGSDDRVSADDSDRPTGDVDSAVDSEADAPRESVDPGDGAVDGDLPPDVRKYERFKKMDGAQYERVNEFLRDRTYITAREWAIARLCADFRTETGVEMTKIGENLPELVPFMTDSYTPQAVNQARASFEEKVRTAGATFLYGAMSGFFTAEELDETMYEVTEIAKFLLEVEGVDLAVAEELDAEERVSRVMREVREASEELRAEEGAGAD